MSQMLGFSLCKAGNSTCPEVVADWCWLSFRRSFMVARRCWGLCKEGMCPFPVWAAGPAVERTFLGKLFFVLRIRASWEAFALCREPSLQGTVGICRVMGFDQMQIPIQVYEVQEAGGLIMAAAVREGAHLDRLQR